MARIRTIKPGFFRNADLYDAEQKTSLPLRVAYAGLWTAADRDGRFEWQPRVLKLDALPHDPVDFEAVLNALTECGFIIKYEVAGRVYGHIPSWTIHQHVNQREAASRIPAPDSDGARTCAHVGKGKEGKGTYTSTMAPAAPNGPLDLKKEFWKVGLSYLEANGHSDKSARSMLGQWRRDFGELAVLNALAAAEAGCVSEPIAYIQKFLKGATNGGTGQPGATARLAAKVHASRQEQERSEDLRET